MIRAARGEGTMVFLIGNDRVRKKVATWLPHAADVVQVDEKPVGRVCENRTCRVWTN
jgi:hypothetical protein